MLTEIAPYFHFFPIIASNLWSGDHVICELLLCSSIQSMKIPIYNFFLVSVINCWTFLSFLFLYHSDPLLHLFIFLIILGELKIANLSLSCNMSPITVNGNLSFLVHLTNFLFISFHFFPTHTFFLNCPNLQRG